MKFLSFGALALALGLKHAYDADHLAAVGTLLDPATRQPWRMGGSWAIGHTLTASLLTVLLWMAPATFSPVLDTLEAVAPWTLVAVGVWGLWKTLQRPHRHEHTHDDGTTHTHPHGDSHHDPSDHGRFLSVGALQGLASNGELLAVLTVGLGTSTLASALGGVVAFSLGVALGMAVYGVVVSEGNERLGLLLPCIFAVLSLTYGCSLLLL